MLYNVLVTVTVSSEDGSEVMEASISGETSDPTNIRETALQLAVEAAGDAEAQVRESGIDG